MLNGCGDIFDEKSGEKEKKEQIQGRTNRRRPIFNSTIQHVVVNLYPNLKLLYFMVVEIYNYEKSGKKEKGTDTSKNK